MQRPRCARATGGNDIPDALVPGSRSLVQKMGSTWEDWGFELRASGPLILKSNMLLFFVPLPRTDGWTDPAIYLCINVFVCTSLYLFVSLGNYLIIVSYCIFVFICICIYAYVSFVSMYLPFLSYLALSYPTLSYCILSCPIMPYLSNRSNRSNHSIQSISSI